MILEKENNNKNKSREYKLLSLDIDIRQHIKKRIKNNFLKKYYKTFQGSSISKEAKNFVSSNINKKDKVMLILDSNHTEEHVFNELKLYAPYVSKNLYCVVMDTVIDFLPNSLNIDRDWKKNNSPLSAVNKYLVYLKEYNKSISKNFILFQKDYFYENRSLITNMPQGVLKRK